MTIRNFQSKPQPASRYVLQVAQYISGGDLSDLLSLATKTESFLGQLPKPTVAECQLTPDEKVLVIRFVRHFDEHPSELDWLVVRNEEYVCYSSDSEGLNTTTVENLARFYEEVED